MPKTFKDKDFDEELRGAGRCWADLLKSVVLVVAIDATKTTARKYSPRTL